MNKPKHFLSYCLFKGEATQRKDLRHIRVFSCASLRCSIYNLFSTNPARTVDLFEYTTLWVIHAKAVTSTPKDIHLACIFFFFFNVL